MAGIQFTIGKNRLEKAFYYGIEMEGNNGVCCSEDKGVHYMILPLLDSGVTDCAWGRMSFDLDISRDSVCYLYLCAMEEPIGKELLMDSQVSFKEKMMFLAKHRCLRFVNKKDVLLYEITGRYLWTAVEIIGENVHISNMSIKAPGDNFMMTFPEVYREKNSFMHRYISIFSSIYNDFGDGIENMEDILEPDKISEGLLVKYLEWFGLDVSGGFISEEIMRALLKDIAWLTSHKGTRQCLERICEMFIGKKPIILERNMMEKYVRQEDASIYNNLYGRSPYDVTMLIEKGIELAKRRQLLYLLEQFKPVRCRLSVVFLENSGVLDGYNYLDNNAYIFKSSSAQIDDTHMMDGTVVIE